MSMRLQPLRGVTPLAQLCQQVHSVEGLGPNTWLSLGSPERLPDTKPLLINSVYEDVWQEIQSHKLDTFENRTPSPWIARLDHASVMGLHYLVATGEGQVVAETLQNRPALLASLLQPVPEPLHADVPVTRVLEGDVVRLGSTWSGAFYHQVQDFLPMLLLLDALPAHVQPRFLTDRLTPVYRALLERLGVPLEQVVEHDWGVCQVERLWMPSRLNHHMSTTPSIQRWLKRSLLEPDAQAPRRLYVSRRDTHSRRVVNEERLLRLLEPLNFTCLTGDEGNFEAQARRFSNAEVVIAPHGGALTHLTFCPPGCLVIELLPEGRLTFPFYNLARCNQLRYLFLICPSVNEAADMEAPLELLASLLGLPSPSSEG